MNCLNCNGELPPRKRKYCSEKCSAQGWYKQNKSKLPIAKCLSCNKEFRQANNGGSDGNSIIMYCSSKCGSAHSGMIRCEISAIRSLGVKKAGRLSRFKEEKAKLAINKAHTDAKHNHCRACGVGIKQDTKQCCKRYCDDCIRKSNKESRRISNRLARQEGKIPSGNDRSRARHYGVDYEPVKRKYVFDIYGWHCADCGIDTPKELKGMIEPNSPELDHIIPISQGGPHTYANVQLLCRQCNASKSDKMPVQ